MIEYKYRKLSSSQRLYDDYDLANTSVVEAEYIDLRNMNAAYAHNPLIECLPFYMSQEELAMSNLTLIPVPSKRMLQEMPLEQKLSSVNSLDRLILPMRWHYELQREVYWCMARVYENRQLIYDQRTSGFPLVASGMESHEKYHVKVPVSEGNPGFSVLGVSGCGKSKAVTLALSHIPQMIVHFPGTQKQFLQVPYLYLVCQPNANMSAIWNGLADALDKAVGNDVIPVYYAMMKKIRRLNEKLEYAVRLCTIFKVGVLIIDEIEFIKMSTRKDTLESLITFNNLTGVALAIVGTAINKQKLFPTWQMCRRFGRDINASEYCNNREEYDQLLDQILEMQWFKQRVSFSQSMKDVFFYESKGTIGNTIAIYKELNKRYLELQDQGKMPIINEQFITACAMSCSEKSHERIQSDTNPYQFMESSTQNISYLARDKEMPKDKEESHSITERVNEIVMHISDKYHLNEDVIRSVVAKIILNDPSLSDLEIEAKARDKLDHMKKTVKAKPKKKAYYNIETACEKILQHKGERL